MSLVRKLHKCNLKGQEAARRGLERNPLADPAMDELFDNNIKDVRFMTSSWCSGYDKIISSQPLNTKA